jgi:DNA (cytosine-5)-methyltransferase 1
MSKLKALDLFSGIGGNSLALGDVVETIAYCERDNHAQAVLLSRMKDGLLDTVPIFSDVTALTAVDLPDKPDIIVAGFPCQDISVAGKGEGIREGNRSGLFYQIMRLTDEIQPQFLFLENVPAIRTRGLDIVLRELTQRGYDCRWTMLSAAQVGANHKRERWFLLASKRERSASNANGVRFGHGKQKLEGQPLSSNSEGIGDKRAIANVADSARERAYRSGATQSNLGGVADGLPVAMDESLPGHLRASYWQEEPEDIPRVTEEKEQRVERIKRLGNSVVPLQARTAFIKLMGLK